jgi:hypothetical protein
MATQAVFALSEFLNDHVGVYKFRQLAGLVKRAMVAGELTAVLLTNTSVYYDPKSKKFSHSSSSQNDKAVFSDFAILDRAQFEAWLERVSSDSKNDILTPSATDKRRTPKAALLDLVAITKLDPEQLESYRATAVKVAQEQMRIQAAGKTNVSKTLSKSDALVASGNFDAAIKLLNETLELKAITPRQKSKIETKLREIENLSKQKR